MLDETYGIAIRPKYYDNIEKYKKPDSLQRLDDESAKQLRSYLDTAEKGLLLPRIAHTSLVILWLVDEQGDCWFSLEEMYKDDASKTVFPRLDDVDYPKGYEKLGHPALIGARKARIAGEIIWDESGCWQISNKSGRYGIRAEIHREHLTNAKRLFEEHGINFQVYYIQVRG